MGTETIDTLIHARWIVPVEPAGLVHDHAAIAIRQGRIVAVLPSAAADDAYSASEVIDRRDHLLVPGFVNCHTHAPMSLMRGMADDQPLADWLRKYIWPTEQKWMSPDFVRDGSQLAIAEMLLSGTTTFNDMYFFPDVVAKAAAQAGIRACIGIIAIDKSTAWADTGDEYIAKGLALHDEYKRDPIIKVVFAPHAPYSVSNDLLKRIRKLSDQLELPVHIHLHETSTEIRDSIEQYGQRPFARLEQVGLINNLLLAVHMTQLTEDEITTAADNSVNVVHCPESNLKLASGFCPVGKLIDAGINVALGTDGAASNNDLSMVGEMRTAALLAKGVSGGSSRVDAWLALQMATLNGARALGLADDVGTLDAGKWADITCIDLARINTQPVFNPVSQLVYAASRDQVSDVWVGGRQLVANGKLTRLDGNQIMEKAAAWHSRIVDDTAPSVAGTPS